jgi:hypothetical protein
MVPGAPKLMRVRRGDLELDPVGVLPAVLAQRSVREARNVDGRTALKTRGSSREPEPLGKPVRKGDRSRFTQEQNVTGPDSVPLRFAFLTRGRPTASFG